MSATCPGQLALIPEGMARYMRVTCMSFWMDAEPDMTVFYLHKVKLELTVPGIASLEAKLEATMKAAEPSAALLWLKYIGHQMIGMSEEDIQEAGPFYVVGTDL